MGKKIYLSAAAHERDNATACPIVCGENVHCIAYMDLVEKRLRQLGFEVKRGFRLLTGDAAMENRIREANQWGADLYYVAHTNAGGGRYSMTMCWDNADSKKKAAVIGKYRKSAHSHKVKVRTDLWEIRSTKMPCLYDELFFHDNAEDCLWFHSGGMKIMAEETVQALCEICGVPYQEPETPKPVVPVKPVKPIPPKPVPPKPAKPAVPKIGDKITLEKEPLYRTARGKRFLTRTGTFYVYDGMCIHGRYRVTNRPERVGKHPLWLYVSGWVKL